MKLWIWIGVIVVILGLGWYFISPLFNTLEVDEESPLDRLDGMSSSERAEFDAAVDEMKDVVKEMDDSMGGGAVLLSEGEFKPRAHSVMGKALLIEEDGKKIIRFEDFDTVNGPNLHIYLSSDLGADDFVDLGEIRATKGNVNYELPDGVDTEKYDKVLVWCVPFKVLFSYAEV
jgi:hypothetical protein